ncbi:MAG: DUF401 family protein [Candidatus Caldatribacteriota bacterium]|nr:DUF401 family protein [Atribacterota bacterium]MDD4288114.1 DUF401 family protein [Atribacterota bacterium]MDD4764859.1 DUF401 family protein [Atribacterota bacterium]
MAEAIKIISVIILIVVLLGLKWNLGLIMFVSSVFLGILFQQGFYELATNLYLAIIDYTTLQLIGIIVLVYILSSILIRTKSMEGIEKSLQNIVSDYRLIVFFIASFLGLIPMPAGAMFSAPLLKEIGVKNNMSSEEIMFFNYWFRHIWEFVWPLIPGVLLYTSVTGLDIRQVMIFQSPLVFIALIIGLLWMYLSLKRKKNNEINSESPGQQWLLLFKSIWSILFIIFLVLFIKINLLIALTVTTIMLLIIYREILLPKLKEIIFYDISFKVVFLVVGIMFFKQVLENTNSMEQISLLFSALGINIWVILFFIPFLLGFLTGSTAGFVGISFPIIMPLLIQSGTLNMPMVIIAYVAGFSGMMMSPMHLCFTVTVEYLKADILKFYKRLSISIVGLIMISSIYVFYINMAIKQY